MITMITMSTWRLGSLRSCVTIVRRVVRLPSVARSYSVSSALIESRSDVRASRIWMKAVVLPSSVVPDRSTVAPWRPGDQIAGAAKGAYRPSSCGSLANGGLP
jgi:hypothetical protein